jgi:hypothetical protein
VSEVLSVSEGLSLIPSGIFRAGAARFCPGAVLVAFWFAASIREFSKIALFF